MVYDAFHKFGRRWYTWGDLLCCNVSLAVVLSFWRKDHNRMDSYRVSMAVVPVSPIASSKGDPWQRWQYEPLHCQKDDGIRCQQVLSLSPECWTKMITEEIEVVGSVYCLSLRDSAVQYHSINVICHNEHRLHITLCRAHFLWTRGARMLPFIWLSLQMWFVHYDLVQLQFLSRSVGLLS